MQYDCVSVNNNTIRIVEQKFKWSRVVVLVKETILIIDVKVSGNVNNKRTLLTFE